jgi:hypothetical protein
MPANTEVFRYAYLLRSDEYIDKRLGHHAWTKPLVTATNLLLSARAAWRRTSKLEIGTYREVFGEEFSALDRSLADSGTIRASRSARDLNWRYRDDPLASTCLPCGTKGRYEVLVARRAGELEAFVVFFIQSDGIASLVDLFGRQVSVTGPALLDAVIQFSRREKVSCIHCCCSDQSELRPVLRDMGFRRRERNSRVVAYTKPNGDAGKRLTAQRWAFSRVEVML